MEAYYDAVPKEVREEFIRDIKARLKYEHTVFMKNLYPYDLNPEIEHYVVWMRKEHKFHTLNSIPDRYHQYEIAYFENHESNKSIPEIDHVQVFLYLPPPPIDDPEVCFLPEFFSHETTIKNLRKIMSTAIGKRRGYLCTLNTQVRHCLIDDPSIFTYTEDDDNPLVRFAKQYN